MAESVVCVGAVVRNASRVLLVRQTKGHPLQHQWTIPWGGLQVGESPADAAVRETREEAGVLCEVSGLLGIQELPFPQEGWIGVIFLARHLEGTPRGDGREADAARYFDRDALDALKEPVEPFSDWLVRRVFHNRFTAISDDPTSPFSPHRALL